MHDLKIYINGLTENIVHAASGQIKKDTRKSGHAFIQWNPYIYCCVTKVKLLCLHRRLNLRNVDKLINLLQRSEVHEVTPETHQMLSDIVKSCQACETYAQKPQQFWITFQDEKDINHTV